jgi:hypothetical protein
MLVRIWGVEALQQCWVGVYTYTAAMEISMKVPQETKNRTTMSFW